MIKRIGVKLKLLIAGKNKALMDHLSPIQDVHVKIVRKMLEDEEKIPLLTIPSSCNEHLRWRGRRGYEEDIMLAAVCHQAEPWEARGHRGREQQAGGNLRGAAPGSEQGKPPREERLLQQANEVREEN